ncbi:MAG: D-hexose-6-phosphate mutarotase [Methylophaga sp.]|nr:MAG: D-hexose-6-phosphate mutarotase [Methylophaga sp.]
MDKLVKLNQQFGIKEQLKFVQDSGDHIMIDIDNVHARARISLYGGQVLSYQPQGEAEDLLFLSDIAYFQEGKAIRGGIPICWPWFGDDPSGLGRPAHGFARNQNWTVLETKSLADDTTLVILSLKDSTDSLAVWPYKFELVIEVSVGNTLGLNLISKNLGNEAFSITQSLHTYLQVADIEQVAVKALDDISYVDKTDQFKYKTQTGDVVVSAEIDRIYQSHPEQLILVDESLNRQIVINSKGNKTAVIWNPWIDLAASMADLHDDAYQHFICVEAANAAEDIVTIPAGGQYSLQSEYSVSRG